MKQRTQTFFIISLMCLASLLLVSATSQAQIPKKITYQGVLTDSLGIPVDGTVQMTFAIYDVASGGSPLWSETQAVGVTNGKYSVVLGAIVPINLVGAKPYWLGITVENDAEMTPRVELTSVMYALFPEDAVGPPGPVGDFYTDASRTFVGRNAGINNNNTDPFFGTGNTFIGAEAGATNTDGAYNTFVGVDAGQDNTTGISNTFVGQNAGQFNTTGDTNTFVGGAAGQSNTTGNDNTFVGQFAGVNNSTGSRNVFLGYEAGRNEGRSNKLYIANSSAVPPLIYGEFDTNLVRINGNFEVTGTAKKPGGGSWANLSDKRLKDVHGSFTRGLEAVEHLQPVSYRYKAENTLELPADREYVGVVAQDIQAVIPEAVEEGEDGYLLVNNDPIIWTMLNAIKELKAENEILRQELNALKEHIGQ